MTRFFFWLFLLSLIVFRYFTTRPVYHDGDKIRLTSEVTSEPIRYERQQGLRLMGLTIYLPLFPEIHYGDIVVVDGKVEEGKLQEALLVRVDPTKGYLEKLRQKILNIYQTSLPEPHASLVAGITLGAKSSIPQDLWENLKKTGTAHVVVASGMNVTMVAGFLMSFLAIFFKRRRAVILALAGVWLYSVISGFDAPIIRAAIMGSIAFSAQEFGRLSSAWRALVYSAALMLIIKPEWLTDLGFILSFVATVSLLLFQKRIAKVIKFLPPVLEEGFSTSLAAQIGVTPILFVTFGYFNVLSPVINALILWTIPLIMIVGGIAGLVGLVIPALATVILYLSYPLTSYFILVLDVFS